MCCQNVSAKNMPVFFIGTFFEQNKELEKYLVAPLAGDKYDNWSLSQYTEELLEGELKHLSESKNLSILSKKEFDSRIENIVQGSNIRDRRIGFLHLDTYQGETKEVQGFKSLFLAFNLSFVQIGEEPNRINDQDSFEVRYTNGVTLFIKVPIEQSTSLEKFYQKFYHKALELLLEKIQQDHSNKAVHSIFSKELLFGIKSFKASKKTDDLLLKVFDNKPQAQKLMLNFFQEALVKEIRKEKELDDVVLLYPNSLNTFILLNWEKYLLRINEVSQNRIKDKNSQIIIRDIKPVCENREFDGQTKYINGYFIEGLLGRLDEKVAGSSSSLKERVDKVVSVATLSRIVLPLKKKVKIDGMSSEGNRIDKISMNLTQEYKGYAVTVDKSLVYGYEIIDAIRKSIDKLAVKTAANIKNIVKERKKNLRFSIEDFCEE